MSTRDSTRCRAADHARARFRLYADTEFADHKYADADTGPEDLDAGHTDSATDAIHL